MLELAPAWPRVAALAGVAVLGFTVGLFGFDVRTISGTAVALSNPDADLSVVAFESDPLTGVRP